ncbi:MAG: hypothetical protein PHN42_04630 [Bacilli bacterium]|nr:hypothetical protein [Bacilli bacterium]
MKRKEMTELDFNITIQAERFAREIYETINDGSFENETFEKIFNASTNTWICDKYINQIYKKTEVLLKDEYDLDMNELEERISKNI